MLAELMIIRIKIDSIIKRLEYDLDPNSNYSLAVKAKDLLGMITFELKLD